MNSKPFPFFNYNLVFLLCLLNLLFQTNAISRSNETDLGSLMAIKDGIEGLSSWNRSFHFCEWQGITCSKHHQRVETLNLSSQNLVGSLSPHIGNLSFLHLIDLGTNKFYGEIPQEIGRLFRLQYFNMSFNSFAGKIPHNLSQCRDLWIIDLGDNKLSGSVPAKLGSLPKLVSLSLNRNRLTGEVPPSLGNLSSLQVLSMGSNSLEGSIPDTLGRLSSLTLFNFQVNRLSGKVPPSLYNISSITHFSIVKNWLTGTLPQGMGITLPNILKFTVSDNQLSGPLPESLANASKIEIFDVAVNSFTGQVPTNLRGLRNLYRLNLASNYLGRGEADDLSFITSLTNSSNLKQIFALNNSFGGVIPNSIANLSTQMERVSIAYNQVSGIIPEGIGNLVNLIVLRLEYNHLHGTIPSSIGDIYKLQMLNLGRNKFTGLIPSSLANLTQLSKLSISGNKLEGNIPSNFGSYRHLRSMYISGNNLNGSIPKQIFGISSLSIALDLSHNSFTGFLPIDVVRLISLGYLDVSGNKISGEIPGTLSNCVSLEELHLENNLFEGTIPQTLSSLKAMRYMDLSSNNLSGQIPNFLENFTDLQRLNLSFNRLDGEVPMKGIFENVTSMSVSGNFELCGGIAELQLPRCETKHGRSIAFILASAIGMSSFFILTLFFLILCWKRKKTQKASSSSMKHQHMKVSYRDLFEATGGFSPTNFLGSGSFGHVYKGILLNQDGKVVAVKVFNLNQKDASKVFMDECEALRTIRHRNLAKILTSCCSLDSNGNDFKALVFEYMENGSLERWLYRDGDEQDVPSGNLDLPQRLDIAIDVASGLAYLHHEGHISIIHRDLKPSNVLLGSDMVAHVSDFGLAKLLPRSMENFSMNETASICVKGSIGYAAPEYGKSCVASVHADVYSYGVLLLEMFTGRRPTDEMFKDGLNLHSYAREALLDRVTELVDPKLISRDDEMIGDPNNIRGRSRGKNKYQDCASAVLRIGVACSVESPTKRMDMRDVHRELVLIREHFLR